MLGFVPTYHHKRYDNCEQLEMSHFVSLKIEAGVNQLSDHNIWTNILWSTKSRI